MQAAKKIALWVGLGLGIILLAVIVLGAIFHFLLEALYVFLIILAVLLVAATIYQIYSILQLVRTIKTVRDEMKPLLNSVKETVGVFKETAVTAGHTVSTIGSTAKLTSEFALGPSVHAVAALVAAQGMAKVFLGKGRIRTQAEERRKQQEEALRASMGGDR